MTTSIFFNPQDLEDTKKACKMYSEYKNELRINHLVPNSTFIDFKCLEFLQNDGFKFGKFYNDDTGFFYEEPKGD